MLVLDKDEILDDKDEKLNCMGKQRFTVTSKRGVPSKCVGTDDGNNWTSVNEVPRDTEKKKSVIKTRFNLLLVF